MAVGSFPLMLTPIVVAMKDLPLVFEEAAAVPRGDASGRPTARSCSRSSGRACRPGSCSCFIIVFNEYLVTLFVHPPDLETAPLRVFNLVRTNGLAPIDRGAGRDDAADLVRRGASSFFRIFGTPPLQGHLHPLNEPTVMLASVDQALRRRPSPSTSSTWTSPTGSSSRCSARPAAARRRRCGCSPGSIEPTERRTSCSTTRT